MRVGWRDPRRENQCSGWRTVLTTLTVSSPLALGFAQAESSSVGKQQLEVVTVSQLIMTVTPSTKMNTQLMQA